MGADLAADGEDTELPAGDLCWGWRPGRSRASCVRSGQTSGGESDRRASMDHHPAGKEESPWRGLARIRQSVPTAPCPECTPTSALGIRTPASFWPADTG